jgi:hypothetical protein
VVSAADERRGAWCRPTLPHGDREREVQGQGIVPFQELALLSPLPFLLATSSFNLYSLSLSRGNGKRFFLLVPCLAQGGAESVHAEDFHFFLGRFLSHCFGFGCLPSFSLCFP